MPKEIWIIKGNSVSLAGTTYVLYPDCGGGGGTSDGNCRGCFELKLEMRFIASHISYCDSL